MPAADESSLSLAEWLVLCLVCEQPRHGFALATLLGYEGDMGQVWRVPKPVIYRALQRLEMLGPVRTTEQQASGQGPVRSLVNATPAGRKATSAWLTRPAPHNRDVRSELLVKLALLDRAGADPRLLLLAQRWPSCCPIPGIARSPAQSRSSGNRRIPIRVLADSFVMS